MYPRAPLFPIFNHRDKCGRRLRRVAVAPGVVWSLQEGLERQLGSFGDHAVADARAGAMAEVTAAIPQPPSST